MGASSPDTPRLIQRIPEGLRIDSDEVLDRFFGWVEAVGLEPYPAQEEALLELMTGHHVILSTPTGSGKSLVALGLHFRAMAEGRRSFYTAPIKALVSEKFFALCEQFGAENVGMLTGDATINWAAPIICCTAEVLSNMSVQQGEAADAPYVVMDEFHYYSDRDRGVAWQIPLLTLPHTTFLLMSATLGDVRQIAERVEESTGGAVAHVHSDLRPVPLDFSYRETPLLETVEKLLTSRKQPIYIVHFTQREASEQAQGLTSASITDRDEKRLIAEAIRDFRFDTPYGRDVQRFLRHGIGVHHAGLLPKYRLLVEQLAQQGLLKVICGTDTLGVGVNIPIRTALFTKLCKFDGEKVSILSVRDFKQISGRAGRKGFDDLGSVVCQAPEHVIENKRLELKAEIGGRKKKINRKKAPTRGYVHWDASTFDRLVTSAPESLSSRFSMSHGLVVSCLQSELRRGRSNSGYSRLLELIDLCHEDPRRKSRLRRDAAAQFRTLRLAGIVEVARDDESGRPTVRVSSDLQADFSLHHTLSLYLVEAVEALDLDSPTHALETLSLVEAILENPRAILHQMVQKAKGDLLSQLKADRVPYEERIARLDEVTWEKPDADFIYATFNLFAEKHPWIGDENIRPKSIARDMVERYSSFDDYVRSYGLARMEGVLLRYLGQVHTTLTHTVPDALKTEEVRDVIAYLRTILLRVDSSLLEEWESLIDPKRPAAGGADPVQPRRTPSLRDDPRELQARIRSECHLLVHALARGDFEQASRCVAPDPDDAWSVDRFAAELAPFFQEYERIVFDPGSRRSHLTLISEREPGLWDVHQTLVDELGDNLWSAVAEVDLRTDFSPDLPLIRLLRISP